MMADNALIFNAVRPWLDAEGFTSRRIAALDAACAGFLAAPDNATIFNAVRPWLDGEGFTASRIATLDAACAQFKGSSAPSAIDVAAGIAGVDLGAIAGPAPAPQPAPVQAGDDRHLPVFLRLASPQAKPEDVEAMARAFAAAAPRYGQDRTKERIAEFVAQIANETGGFRLFNENLNYSARRIRQVWPSRVKTDAEAQRLAHNPEALANVVYQRASMGNTQPGDGWRYRGRGALQLTFRANYKLFGQRLGIDLEGNPDLASDPAVSVLIALEFFKVGNVNAAIDRGNFREARRITNGAALGLEEVARLRAKALAVL